MSQILFNEVLEAAPIAGLASVNSGSMSDISPKGYTITLPNNFFYIGRVLRFTAMGTVDPQVAQINFRILVAAETQVLWTGALFSTANPANHSFPVPYLFQLTMTCRAISNGTSSSIIGVANFISSCNIGIGSVMYPFQDTATPRTVPPTAPAVQTSFNVNAALDVVFQGQSAFVDTQQFLIESLN